MKRVTLNQFGVWGINLISMKKSIQSIRLLVGISLIFTVSHSSDQQVKVPQAENEWFKNASKHLAKAIAQTHTTKRGAAKNIILFVGDGMGISTVTAARILEGQNRGQSGEENMLSFDDFPSSGLAKTYNTNAQTPDSAGTMTAMVTGVKTKMGMISVNNNALRANCASSKDNHVMTLIEMAELKGLSTGIVTTARLTHATPAAVYAHTPERKWENDSELTKEAVKNSCKDIASQFLAFDYGDGIDVAMGGGRREFIPESLTDIEGEKGKRSDGRDLRMEWKGIHKKGVYIETLHSFNEVNTTKTSKLLGLFNPSHMRYEQDRKNDIKKEPSLSQMTKKSIEILQKNEKGFVLIVESGRIDHAHHAGNAFNALSDTIEFSNAVAVADKMTSDADTLIIATADHSHVFTMAGYPKRGNPILGKVRSTDKHGFIKEKDEVAIDGLPYTTLGYANGRGYMHYGEETDAGKIYDEEVHTHGRVDLSKVDTTRPGFHQEATVPLEDETHGGEDVSIHSKGPGSHLFTGVIEQNVIFHVMEHMGNLINIAQE